MSVSYLDRVDAGRSLAQEVAKSNEKADLVLGVARGGLVVAREVADSLGAALDVWAVSLSWYETADCARMSSG